MGVAIASHPVQPHPGSARTVVKLSFCGRVINLSVILLNPLDKCLRHSID